MSSLKAGKGIAEVNQSGYYLLGRPYNKDGIACGHYIPLRHYAMAVTIKDSGDKTVEHKSKNVTITPATGLVVSDNNGLLVHPSREVTLSRKPFTFQDNKAGNGKVKALFFPSHMLPMAYACFEGNWLKKLHTLLEDQQSLTHSSNVVLRRENRVALKKSSVFSVPDPNAKDKTAKSYAQWYEQLFSEHNREQPMEFIEIPQLYTIVVVFSSSVYMGATVCLSQFPNNLRFAGTEDDDSSIKKATSQVKEVSHPDNAGTANTSYAATFWLEGNLPQQLKPSEQYCRFDIDLSTVSLRSNKDKIKESKIPHDYNLIEQVLHLPISTIAGRSSLVNGDPISVEEALVNHCPQYFKDLTDKITDSAYVKPQDAKLSNGKSVPAGVWHHLQTYKSYYESLGTGLEKGVTIGTVSKLINASLSQIDPDSEFTKFVQSATGISGAAKSYLDIYKKFDPASIGKLAKGVKAMAELVNSTGNLAGLGSLHVFPAHLRPFASTLGKVFDTALGTPLSFLELGYNMNEALDKSNVSDNAETNFMNTSKLYTHNTNSFSAVLRDIDKAQSKEKKEALKNVREKLIKVINGGEAENTLTRIKDKKGDSEVQLLNLSFKFNRSDITLGDKGKTIINEIVKFLVLVEPIPIKIRGHACRIGTDFANNKIGQLRADAFATLLAEGLKGKVDDDIWSIWTQQIQTISMGSSISIDAGLKEENLARNRRVEVIFMFDKYVQNPPCRSGMLAFEASRKGVVAASVNEDKAWVETAKGGFELAVGLGAALMAPAAVLAYTCYATGKIIEPGWSYMQRMTHDNKNYIADLKKFSEFDIAGQNLLLQQDEYQSVSSFMNKAYLKRGLALNGLIRLIHRYYYEQSIVKDYRQHFPTSMNSGHTAKSFEDYDIGGYIQHFLLRDDWSIGNDLFAVHLDEFWLDQKGSAASYSSFTSWIGGAAYVWNRTWQEEHSKTQLVKGQKYQQYLPIHYMNSHNLDYFKSLFTTLPLKFNNKKIVETMVISARPRGSDEPWKLLDRYLDKHVHRCLSPYDQIRVLIVLNKENDILKKALVDSGRDLKTLDHNDTSESNGPAVLLPIAIRAVKQNMILNDKTTPTIGFATDLNHSKLLSHELDLVGGEDLFGAIINPTFSLGRNVISGTRPMADYGYGLLEALFDDSNGSDENNYNTPAQVYTMRYFYECYIPGSKDTEQPVYLDDKKNDHLFNLRLDPKRKYKLLNKQNNSFYTVQDDYHFYAKNFLESDTITQNKVIYPRVFMDTVMQFSVYQKGKHYVSNELFDWNAATEIELVVRTVSQGEKLKHQGFSQNSVPIQVRFGEGYKIEQAKMLYRIGKIYKKEGKWCFDAVDKLDGKLVLLAAKYEKMTSEDLNNLCITDKPTDIFAFHVSMSYINAVGVPQEGLKPFGDRRGAIFGSNNPFTDVRLKVSSAEGTGLDNAVTSNTIAFRKLSKYDDVPKNWIAYNKDDEVFVRQSLKKRDSDIDALKAEGQLVDSKQTKLGAWLMADPNKKNDIINTWMHAKG
ncbi:OmpA family protein [Moritella sp.]|uniref:OmpA family protein n=1 Tax=Moritella sp. TaxID=78556 RepID=UPI001D947216|nr:OmpA family protein [Moritella sp.]MCJ8351202.1 OmpA family protein [Moritella sp.]NQZ41484.1 OmpA family protein [Moritella sp.]